MLDEAEVAIRHGLRRVRAIPTSTSALREMKLLLFFARVAEKRRDWSGLEQIGQELFALARSRGYYWSPVRTNAGRYLGLAAMHKGQYEKAVPLLREAADWLSPRPDTMAILVNTSINLALCQMFCGRYEEALATNMGTLRLLVAGVKNMDDLRAKVLNNTGVVLFRMRRYEEAIVHYQEALHIREKLNQTEEDSYGRLLNNRSDSRRALKQYEESEADIRRAIAILEREPSRSLPFAIGTFAMLCLDLGREDDAKELNRRELSLESFLDPIDVAQNLEQRAGHFRSLLRIQDAEPLFARAAGVRSEIGTDPAPPDFRA